MGLIIHNEKINEQTANELIKLCPFGAISYGNELKISSACKMCKMCVKKGPLGAITFEEELKPVCDKSKWNGVAVFAEQRNGKIHPVSLEMLGKARTLTNVIKHEVLAVIIGYNIKNCAEELLCYGADKVYMYDSKAFENFTVSPYANAFEDFINRAKPSSILVGATMLGRSLAPKVAARVHTGLTADCTVLDMKENTDLIQIRPAFGGNIMAQIVTPNTRPQFCTVRYKVFSAPEKSVPTGEIIPVEITDKMVKSNTEVLNVSYKPKETDISDADVIVAVGRGVKKQEDLKIIKEFADKIGANIACTRPLVEAGWFDAKHQIGLSGRTVKPKLIITLGISGSVQFAAGMRNSDKIIAVNSDKNASIFDIAHYGFIGDIYEIIPKLYKLLGGSENV